MTLPRRVTLVAVMLFAGLAFALWASPASQAAACTTTWNGSTTGVWSTGAEWNAGVPDANDVVCINSGVATLSPGGATVTEVHLGGNGKLIVSNTSLVVEDPAVAGAHPDGQMTVEA